MKTPIFVLALSAAAGLVLAQEPDPATLKILGQVAFTEGPAWHPSGNVYFTDIENNRIMRLDPSGQTHIFRTPSGRANGLLFDSKLRLHACEGSREGGNRRVTRTELNGTITVLTDRYRGARYNAPNDLVIDSKGRIFFTDPNYGERDDMQILDDDGNPVEGVYRIDPDGDVAMIIEHEVDRPNGIALSRDEEKLFVCDNNTDERGRNRKLWSFDLKPDGTVDKSSQKQLFDWGTDRGPDGMALGPDNLLYVTAGFNFPDLPAQTAGKYKAGVYVIDPTDGDLVRVIRVPADMITNCAFGGEDGETLFITAGHKLWSTQIE